MKTRHKTRSLLLVPLIIVMSACAWDYGGSDSVSVKFRVKNTSDPFRQILSTLSIEPPTDINQFNCFALNVVGQGIGPSSSWNSHAQPWLENAINRQTHCSYLGPTSSVASVTGTQGTMEVRVPAGPRRLIQVLGLHQTAAVACPTAPLAEILANPGNFGIDAVVEVGRDVVDLTRDFSKTITNTYSAAGNFKDLLACDKYSSLVLNHANLAEYWRLSSDGIPDASTIVLPQNFGTLGSLSYGNTTGAAVTSFLGAIASSSDKPLKTAINLAAGLTFPAGYALPGAGFSLAIWAKAGAWTANETLLGLHYGPTVDFIELRVAATTGNIETSMKKGGAGLFTPTMADVSGFSNEWVLYTIVFDINAPVNHLMLYLNDNPTPVSQMAAANGSDLALSGQAMTLGKKADGTNPFGGQLDEFAIFNAPLTPAEIQHLYRVGKGTEAP